MSKQSTTGKSAISKTTTETVAPPTTNQRVMKDKRKIHHDLYQLNTSKMIKDTSVGKVGDPDMLRPVDHQHFYHSVDSSGRAKGECEQIGNHFHKMEIIKQEAGQPPLVKCVSGPMKWSRVKQRNGRFKKVMVPVNDYDDHTHEVEYLHSEEIDMRVNNVEAAKVKAAIELRQSAAHVGSLQGDNGETLGEIQG